MVPPVRSRAARFAVPQWRFRRNARDQEGAALCGDRGGQMQRGPRKTCFAGKTNSIPATIQKQLVQLDGLFLRFLVRKRGLPPLCKGRC